MEFRGRELAGKAARTPSFIPAGLISASAEEEGFVGWVLESIGVALEGVGGALGPGFEVR